MSSVFERKSDKLNLLLELYPALVYNGALKSYVAFLQNDITIHPIETFTLPFPTLSLPLY